MKEAQYAIKEVLQGWLSTVETRINSFGDKVTLVEHKITSVEAEVMQMNGNFERIIRESIKKELKQKFGKEIREKLEMEVTENVPEKYNKT